MGLFCLGYNEAAAELGFAVYETRDKHPKYVPPLVLEHVLMLFQLSSCTIRSILPLLSPGYVYTTWVSDRFGAQSLSEPDRVQPGLHSEVRL